MATTVTKVVSGKAVMKSPIALKHLCISWA
jgi:hypothetical protein